MPKKIKTEPTREKEEEKEKAEIEYILEEKKKHKEKHDEAKILKTKLKKKEAEIKHLKKENTKLKEEYLRQMAERENLRKRLEREKSEYYQYALSEFLREFLTVLDNFERALESKDQGNGKSFREGIELIYKQHIDLLLKQGVIPIEIKERKFDPHFHQAFVTEESEGVKEPEVTKELQKGYILHGRLLRPALVKVIVPKKGE